MRLVLITLANREGSDESAPTRSLTRAFTSHIYSLKVEEGSDQNLDLLSIWIRHHGCLNKAFVHM